MMTVSSLNSIQLQAVQSVGTVIVIAGPGTGKTKTLTERISYLINERKVEPHEILALTFTKKAAAEMKERLKHLQVLPYISTFHSLAFDILKKANESIEIIAEKERNELLQIIQEKKNDKKLTKKETKNVSLAITQFKNNLIPPETPKIITLYNQLLKERGLMDYDDLLLRLYTLLKENNEKVFSFKNSFSHILIDEFQDTNKLQYEIVKLLLKTNSFFIIGDPFQSIYSFRGAQEEILQNLRQDFPDSLVITLNTNYRSCNEIIKASSALFPKNIPLKPVSNKKGEVVFVKTINEYTEGEYIAELINEKIGGTDLIKAGVIQDEKREVRFSDFAVIYRTHAIGRIAAQKLSDSGIPYQIVGGKTIYEEPEVSFIIYLLQYINHKSSSSLKNLLYSSVVPLSLQSKKRLSLVFDTHKRTSVRLTDNFIEQYISSKKDIHTIFAIKEIIKNADTEAQNNKLLSLIHIVTQHPLLREYVEKNINREKNIHVFKSSITQFDEKKDSVGECIRYLDFLNEHEFYDPICDKVTFLTLHASKGLEFKYVFICGFEDGIIPFDSNDIDIQEEKRLLYVGMTRAKEGLYLIAARQRNKKESSVSRFYTDIDNFVRVIDDEVIEKRSRQIKKWKEKKSQLKLF